MTPPVWRHTGVALLACALQPALAQSGADEAGNGMTPQLREVVVSSRRSLEERFFATGSLVVVDRQDIEEMGVETVGDVLRQLPGVQVTTNASGGVEIRMRGLDSSATRVLVDGQRSGGRAQLPFDQLPAELLERIEVVRAPTAEFSGAAGGTLNFVLRQASPTRSGTLRLSDNHVWGRNAGQAFVSRSGPLGGPPTAQAPAPAPGQPQEAATEAAAAAPTTPWSYFFALSGGGLLTGADSVREQLRSNGSASSSAATRNRREEWTLLPRLNGRLSAQDQLALRATLTTSALDGRYDGRSSGTSAGNAFSSQASDNTQQAKRYLQAGADWTRRLAAGKLETGLNGSALNETVERQGRASTTTGAGSSSADSSFQDLRHEALWSLKSKFTGTQGSLLWMLGAELESRRARVDTQSSSAAPEQLRANVERQVLWGQNEWALPHDTTLTAGLRAESQRLQSLSASAPAPAQRLNFLQPSLHTRTPLSEDLQWRANLSRITRNPGIWDLLDRSVPSAGSNSAANPDQVGNPGLRPEVSQTLDTGLEQRLPRQSQMGLNLFVRQIEDVIAARTRLSGGRFSEQRENIGSAIAWGLEADLKAPLTSLADTVQQLAWTRSWTVSAHGSLLQSRMRSGADAGLRIPGQARYVASVNLAKPMRRTGGAFGGVAVSLTGPASQSTADLRGTDRARATLDAYVGDVVAGLGYWRFGVYNLTNAGQRRERSYSDGLGTVQESSTTTLTPRIFVSVGTQF